MINCRAKLKWQLQSVCRALTFLLASRLATGSNVLVFTMPGIRSHHMNMVKISEELHSRGHNVSVLISAFDEIGQNVLATRGFPGLHKIKYSGAPGMGSEEWATKLSRDSAKNTAQLLEINNATAYRLYEDKHTLQQLQSTGFDVLLRDTTIWFGGVLEEILGVPSVELIPTMVALPYYSIDHSIPLDTVAYAPQFGSGLPPIMDFWQRTQNYIQYLLIRFFMTQASADPVRFHRATGQSWATLQTGVSSSAAVISIGDWAFEVPHPMPPRIHVLGPILADKAKPLPADVDSFLTQGGLEGGGAVYVSMGTLARLDATELHSMAQALSGLPNPVLWKLDAAHLPGNATLSSLGLTPNIKVVPWVNQNDVLGHAAVKAFVTQAGINSMYEAIYHAKPVVSVPLITEQAETAARAVYHGFGVTVTSKQLLSQKGKAVKDALIRVLAESSFKENAVQVSRRLHNRPRSPTQLAADVIEQVIRTGGDPYLQTHQHKLTWWQLSLLDVKLFLLLAVTLVLCLFCIPLWWLLQGPGHLKSVWAKPKIA